MPEGYRRARRSKRMFRRRAALGSCVRQTMGCEKGRPGTGQAVKTSHIALRARGLQAAGREGLAAGGQASGRRRPARARRGLSRDPLGTTADAFPRGPLIALGHDFTAYSGNSRALESIFAGEIEHCRSFAGKGCACSPTLSPPGRSVPGGSGRRAWCRCGPRGSSRCCSSRPVGAGCRRRCDPGRAGRRSRPRAR